MSTTLFAESATSLEASRRYCEQLTRPEARNFYYGLKLLPEPKRSAMFALYAYMRLVDDIADDEDGRSHDQRVDDWRPGGSRRTPSWKGRPPARRRPRALAGVRRRWSGATSCRRRSSTT